MKQDLRKYLPRNPVIVIKDKCWFYVGKKGIEIVVEARKNREYLNTEQVVLPYAKLEKALRDYKLALKKQKKAI